MITIYGKANCGFCTKAKAFADQREFTYEYKDVGMSKDTLNELMDRAPVQVKSVPQIFIGNEYIGGYDQFTKYVEETGYNGSGETL
jgi:glutaredoxin 1